MNTDLELESPNVVAKIRYGLVCVATPMKGRDVVDEQ